MNGFSAKQKKYGTPRLFSAECAKSCIELPNFVRKRRCHGTVFKKAQRTSRGAGISAPGRGGRLSRRSLRPCTGAPRDYWRGGSLCREAPGGICLRRRAGGAYSLRGSARSLRHRTGTAAGAGMAAPPFGGFLPGLGAEPSCGAGRADPRRGADGGGHRRRPDGAHHAEEIAGVRRDHLADGRHGRSGKNGGAADGRGLRPLRAGGRRGAVCPARRHFGRIFAADGAAGALRILRR